MGFSGLRCLKGRQPRTAGLSRARIGSVQQLSDHDFEQLVGEALDSIPADLAAAMSNVVVLVETEPPADDPELLGVYDGTPLTERDGWWAAGALPDRITIFQGPLQRLCTSAEQLRAEIAITVVHEVAHHFGINDDHLHELGWG